jgi:hypothetical protein
MPADRVSLPEPLPDLTPKWYRLCYGPLWPDWTANFPAVLVPMSFVFNAEWYSCIEF